MLQTASYTDTGGRTANEDSTRQARRGEDRLCLVVADGLGGHGGGAQASAAAADTICRGWKGEADPEALKRLIQMGHEAVTAIQTPQCAMKSTVVALELAGRQAAWAHVGDSRLYHFVDGRLTFQTKDHSASQIAVYMGDITVDQIRVHEDRNRVLRALGQEGAPTVEAGEETLCPGRHAFLLCSDGFWEYVLEDEMAADLIAAADPLDWLIRMRSRLAGRVPANNDNNTAAAAWVDIPARHGKRVEREI